MRTLPRNQPPRSFRPPGHTKTDRPALRRQLRQLEAERDSMANRYLDPSTLQAIDPRISKLRSTLEPAAP